MKRALTLAIETSNPSIGADATGPITAGPGIAMGRVDVGSGEVEGIGSELLDPGRRTEEELAPAIARLCGRAGVRAAEIERIAVSVGPGGYTALRIAIVTAKLLAEVSGGRCVAIPSAHVAAWHVLRDADERAEGVAGAVGAGTFAVALQSKADAAFVTFFKKDDATGRAVALDEGALLTADEFSARASERGAVALAGDQHLPSSFRERALAAGIPVVAPRLSAQAVLDLSAWYTAVPPDGLAPMYAREPEAVTKWRELRGRLTSG